jgi:hypothetical protein
MTCGIPAIPNFQNLIRPAVSTEVPRTRGAAVGVSTNFNVNGYLAEHSGRHSFFSWKRLRGAK